MYIFTRLGLIVLAVLGCWSAQGLAQEPETETLTGLVEHALESNPDLQAAEARWRMFERKIVPAGSLDDPMLSASLMNYPIDSFDYDETPMTGNELRLSQKFPFPGKLGSKAEAAEQQALWYRGVYRDGRLELERKVEEAYYRLYYFDRAIGVTEKNLGVLDDFISLTETRYAVGKGLQQDVLKAQLERSRLMDALFTLRQKRGSAQAQLNALLDRPTGRAVVTPTELEIPEVGTDLQTLQRAAEDQRPLFAAYRALTERFRAQRKLARLNYYPDVNLWAGYRFRGDSGMDPVEGADFVSAGLSINLPIDRSKRDAAVLEAEAGIDMATKQLGNFRSQVHNRIHDAYLEMEKSRDQMLLYRTGIIPQAEQSFAASLAAYQVDRVDFLTLLDGLLKLYRYEMDYYGLQRDFRISVARLEAFSGLESVVVKGEP